MNLFVGNLSSDVTTDELKQLFAEFGTIQNARIIFDPATNTPRGFGFVEYTEKGPAFEAIDNLDMTYFMGQVISVKEAKSKTNDTRNAGGNKGSVGFNKDKGNFNNSQRRSDGGGVSSGGFNKNKGSYGSSEGNKTYGFIQEQKPDRENFGNRAEEKSGTENITPPDDNIGNRLEDWRQQGAPNPFKNDEDLSL